MSARKARTDLQRESTALLLQVLSGDLEGAAEMLALPIDQWHTVIARLHLLCPGFTRDEYVAALVRANRDNR
jgi:hypothetical protein